MDVSDGLVDDLGKLCTASGVAARVNASQVPTHPLLRRQFPDECLSLALGGGEDYVLLFAGPPDVVRPLIHQLGEGSAVIGTVVPSRRVGRPGPGRGGGRCRKGAFAVRRRLGSFWRQVAIPVYARASNPFHYSLHLRPG